MDAWQELSITEYDAVWDRFEGEFSFRPSVRAADFPGITEPVPFVTYDISDIYYGDNGEYDDAKRKAWERDLNAKTLYAFKRCVSPDQRLYVLDWQHRSFWFYPHRSFDANSPSKWAIPVLPDGDYYIFLGEDFSFGMFGHPWEQTICVFGQVLLDAFENAQPIVFTKVLRENGRAH